MNSFFHKLAVRASKAVGSSYAFLGAIALLTLWLATGPVFGYSDTWQLIINTSTTIVTFLMVFLIQNTQNRDSLSLHLKLDELIRATRGARNSMIDLGKLSDQQLDALELEFERICKQCDQPPCEQPSRSRRRREDAPDRSAEQGAPEGGGRRARARARARAALVGGDTIGQAPERLPGGSAIEQEVRGGRQD
jgi:low affinity Fe/Cu permease